MRDAQVLYGLLRETWERAVEEVLLNNTVRRFEFDVRTRRLGVLTDINQTDVDIIDAGMAKSSRFLAGHDTPRAGAEPMPAPEEINADIIALENSVKAVRTRRR